MINLLTALAQEAFVASLVNGKVRPRPNKVAWYLKAVSALLAGAGAFLMVLSASRFLEARFAPDLAALLTAICAFALAGMVALLAYYLNRHGKISSKDWEKSFYKILKDVKKEMAEPIEDNPKAAMAFAAVLGFILSRLRH